MKDKIEALGFVQINNPYNGPIYYRCPKGHIINCFANGNKYDCPVCIGLKPTIAGQLNDLNKKYNK